MNRHIRQAEAVRRLAAKLRAADNVVPASWQTPAEREQAEATGIQPTRPGEYTPPMSGPLTPPVARLLALVEADGRTRNEIAAAAGMAPAQLSHVLTGHRADPSITTVGRILAALGKSWTDLDVQEKPRGKRRPRS